MSQYIAIVRDSRNIMVHAVHFSASDLQEAETKASFFLDSKGSGVLDRERIAKYKKPFRLNVGEN